MYHQIHNIRRSSQPNLSLPVRWQEGKPFRIPLRRPVIRSAPRMASWPPIWWACLLICLIVVLSSGQTSAQCLECPEDIRVAAESPEGTVVEFGTTITNLCLGEIPVECTPPSGSLFPIGATLVVCETRDRAGLTVYCSFLVEVEDTEPPRIICPSNMVVQATGPDGAIVEWKVEAEDNASDPEIQCEPPSGSLLPIGSTRVVCVARDGTGQEAYCGFLVEVLPPPPLEIHARPDDTLLLRWYGQGHPEHSPALGSSNAWERMELPVMENGSERTMMVRPEHTSGFFRLVADPQAPPPDQDGDGIPDVRDHCPGTPRGLTVDEHGCAPVQIMAQPGLWLEPDHSQWEEIQGWLGELAETEEIQQLIGETQEGMASVADLLRQGGLREAAGLQESLLGGYRNALQAFDTWLRTRPSPADEAEPGLGDTKPHDLQEAAAWLVREKMASALQKAEDIQADLQQLVQGIAGPEVVRGRVALVDDAGRMLVLEDGKRLVLAEGFFEEAILPDAEIEAEVMMFKDQSGVAISVSNTTVGEPFPGDLFPLASLRLRIAPNQPFPPYSLNSSFILHDPAGYRHDNVLWLEKGMRLAVDKAWTPKNDGFVIGKIRYSMKLDLSYTAKNNATKNVTLAHFLTPTSEPVPFPSDMSQANATLTATVRRQHCTFIGLQCNWSSPQTVVTLVDTVKLRPQFSYAQALYTETEFELEDSPLETGFGSTEIYGLFKQSVLTQLPGVTFSGVGFGILNGNSTSPNLAVLGNNTPLAIHNWDFYTNPNNLWDPLHLYGITNAAGVRWPRAVGLHNGRPFAYSCGLPSLIRDRIDVCNGMDSYYRLPFAGGYPIWTMGQGNFGGFTHQGNSAFAFDFIAPQGTQILAARGGTVVDTLESRTANCYNALLGQCINCMQNAANYVLIRHQDNTHAWYLHMPQNGVYVNPGDKIRRGDLLGIVGNTGCSTTPHLHFEVKGTMFGASIPAKFENCFVPMPGDLLISQNKAWWK